MAAFFFEFVKRCSVVDVSRSYGEDRATDALVEGSDAPNVPRGRAMASASSEVPVTLNWHLHEIAPSEQVGRDTIARYQAQFRATALQCLEILDQKTIDRVYCEFHDDFVSRKTVGDGCIYQFFQVKTVGKRNHQWSVAELFGIAKSGKRRKAKSDSINSSVEETAEKIAKSYAGKLLHHTVRFGDSCEKVCFLTNVNLDDDVELIAAAIAEKDLANNSVLPHVCEKFNSMYGMEMPLSSDEISARVQKLSFSPGLPYLSPGSEDFETLASASIHKYSEIDLTLSEGAEIAKNLLALVEKKSFPKIKGAPTAESLNVAAGVGLEDLLDLLSISKGGYRELLNGGDSKALKSASIIQRKLEQAGASSVVIDTACKWKVDWDNWFRKCRHLSDADISFLLVDISGVREKWCKGEVSFSALQGEVVILMNKWQATMLGGLLSRELIMGGILAELVRSESR